MREISGATALITGGAEGIGLGIARALAAEGANVVLADIDPVTLEAGVSDLKSVGARVVGVVCDVAVRGDLEAAAEAAIDAFGKVHVLVNNAGVATTGPQHKIAEENWRWVIDVNLMGVVYGAQVLTPLIRSHGEGGHIVNVASMAGMGGVPMAGPYCATKMAVVGLSECWRGELADEDIGVSVLCPAYVKSRIYASARNRQPRYGGPIAWDDIKRHNPRAADTEAAVKGGIEPDIVGARVVEAIRANELYVFTHPHYRELTDRRAGALARAFETADASPALADVERGEIVI